MKTKRVISIVSIIISILGTYIIWDDSQKTILAITNLLMETTSTVGYWQDNAIDQVKIREFNISLQNASKLDIKGFCLLMFGFLLQIITHFDLTKFKYWLKHSFKMLLIIVKPKTKRVGKQIK